MASCQPLNVTTDFDSELETASKLLNGLFSGERQITLMCRLWLGIDMISCVLRDVSGASPRAEITRLVIDQLLERSPPLEAPPIAVFPSPAAAQNHITVLTST